MSNKRMKIEDNNTLAVKIYSNGEEVVVNEDNFLDVIKALKKKIEETDKCGKLCFYIGYMCNSKAYDLIYWYCDGTNKKVEWCAEILNDHIPDNDGGMVLTGYEYEHNLLKDSARSLALEYKADYDYTKFDIKKIDCERFDVLTDELMAVKVDEDFPYLAFDGYRPDNADEALNCFFKHLQSAKEIEDEELEWEKNKK